MSATDLQVAVPQRIQRRRIKGYRLPQGAVYVGRGSRWGNPWIVGEALARVPALDGSAWEPETRISGAGMSHPFHHPGGLVTNHTSRLMSRDEVVETYRRELAVHGRIRVNGGPTLEDIRRELAGKDLACWCSLEDACHGDVLLHAANPKCGSKLARTGERYTGAVLQCQLGLDHAGVVHRSRDEEWTDEDPDVLLHTIATVPS